MTARVIQIPVEVVNSGSELNVGPPVRVTQQTQEVQSTMAAPVRMTQQTAEVINTLGPPVRLAHQAVEVLSSSIESLFDTSFGFWALAPNRDVVERYEWATDIETSRSGTQIRASLRSNPRVQVEFDVITSDDAEMTLIDALINGWQGKSYYLPVWQDRTRLGLTITGGETSIAIDLELYQYADGGLVGIWNTATDFQILQILEVDEEAGELIFATPVGRAWGPDAWIAPIRRAWLQPEASASRFTGSNFEARLVFNARDPVPFQRFDWDELNGGPWTADGMALFAHTPNWTQSPRITYRRRLENLGDETVMPWRQDPSGQGWITRQELHTMTSRAEINQMLQWAAFRRGRTVSYLAPVRDRAIRITRSNGIDDSQIYVISRNYTALLPELSPRAYLALRDASGWVVRRVVGVESFGSEEALNLNASIGRAGTPAGWQEAYLCEPAHLASDIVEVRWWDRDTADIVISHEQVKA